MSLPTEDMLIMLRGCLLGEYSHSLLVDGVGTRRLNETSREPSAADGDIGLANDSNEQSQELLGAPAACSLQARLVVLLSMVRAARQQRQTRRSTLLAAMLESTSSISTRFRGDRVSPSQPESAGQDWYLRGRACEGMVGLRFD